MTRTNHILHRMLGTAALTLALSATGCVADDPVDEARPSAAETDTTNRGGADTTADSAPDNLAMTEEAGIGENGAEPPGFDDKIDDPGEQTDGGPSPASMTSYDAVVCATVEYAIDADVDQRGPERARYRQDLAEAVRDIDDPTLKAALRSYQSTTNPGRGKGNQRSSDALDDAMKHCQEWGYEAS